MPIHILSEVVASQIAAGEVVERPASVVKELVENALDAGATLIQVESEAGGRRLLRVTDNGSGIPADEAEIAFLPHATSKLQSVDDLTHIQTLGFRGEALASIASVAQVTMLTRTADEPSGTLIRVRGGVLTERRAAGTPIGSVITVENLFFNTPARVKFMKAETTERRHIDSLVTRYATAYPNVRFSLIQDGRLAFQTTGNGGLEDVLVEMLGLDTMREMIEVLPSERHRPDLPPVSVIGYTSAPSLTRNARNQITLFVNGRYIQDSSLTYAVTQAYHTLIPSDRYPVAVLLITLPPEEVDVNVHPTKAEVRFRAPEAVFSAIHGAVRRAVIGVSPVPAMSDSAFGPPTNSLSGASEPSPNPADQYTMRTMQRAYDLPPTESGYGYRSQQMPPSDSNVRPVYAPNLSATPTSTPRTLPPMRVIGQVGATYIVAEGPAGVYLVDQHAAHERILYERFMAEHAAHSPVAQRTLDTLTLELTPASTRLIEENLDALTTIGFAIEPFGERTFQVRAVPALLADRSPEDSIRLILDDLENGDEPGESTIEARIILRVCKAAAVKAGQVLSYNEMVGLMRQLEICAAPRTCPHGRPTMIHLSSDQLAREFGRT